jgi:hypothetical protein
LFLNPLAMQCKPCRQETNRRYRQNKKANVDDAITTLLADIHRIKAILIANRWNVDDVM